MSTNVLVTGGTGFLGKHLARTLHKQGYQVTATGRNRAIGEELESEGLTFIPSDLADTKHIVAMCAGKDAVFHCGALSSPWGDYTQFYQSNVVGTRNIIEGCRQHQVDRLIYVSTPSLYFDYTNRLNVSESDPLPEKPANAYAETKRLAEEEVSHAFQAGLPVITIRPRAIFGPGDQAILPRLMEANRQGRLPLINGGQALMDLTYIDNVVDVLIQCMSSPPATLGQTYNITNGEPLPLIHLLELLFHQLGEPLRGKKLPYPLAYGAAALLEWRAKWTKSEQEPLLTRYTVGLLGKSLTLNITAAKQALNYKPRKSVEEGISEYVAWIKQRD